MKLTESTLIQLIKEEIQNIILEQIPPGDPDNSKNPQMGELDPAGQKARRINRRLAQDPKKLSVLDKAILKSSGPEAFKKARQRAIQKINALTKQAMVSYKLGNVVNNSAFEKLSTFAYGNVKSMEDAIDELPDEPIGDSGGFPRP